MTASTYSQHSSVFWRLGSFVRLLVSGCLCCIRDWHRRECEWEQWYGAWALVCCQLFWWLQIASALVGWSRHQQAEELSKELPQLSLIHAWCTTRWQNTATAYGGGGGRQRVEGTGGGASEENHRVIHPILEIVIKQTKQFSPLHPKCLPLHCSSSC